MHILPDQRLKRFYTLCFLVAGLLFSLPGCASHKQKFDRPTEQSKQLSSPDVVEQRFESTGTDKEQSTARLEDLELAEKLSSEGRQLYSKGSYQRAEPLYRQALEIYEKAYGPEHPSVATILNNLALLYENLGDYARAEPLYQQALEIYEKAYGPEHASVAVTLNNLAALYCVLADYGRAEPLYQRALTIREEIYGSDHPSVATTLNNLAVLYENLGDYARAEPLYQQALEIYEKAYGPEHPSVATTTNNLAALYERLGDYGRAVPLYQQALTIREEIYGSDHPSVATTLNSLATLYLHLREYSQAEPLYQRALAIREEIYGSDHPSVATTLNNLAWLSKKSGDYARAEPLYQQALEIYEKAYGPEHPSVATALNNLAWLYKKLGDYSRAEPLYLQALSIAVIRASPEILWKVQSGLSKVLAGQDNKGAAIFFGKQAVNTIQSLRARLVPLKEELQQSYLKEKEWVYKDLADLLIDQGRLAEAQQVLAMLKEEEYFDFVRRDAGRTEGRSTQTSFSKPETEWAHRFQEVNERLAAIGGELAELKMQKKDGLTPAQENRLEQLKRDAKLARQAFVASVGELKDAFAKMGGGRAIEFGKKDLDSLGALQGTLKRLGHGVVLVHYLVTRDRLRILVTTPHIQLHRDTLVSEVDLNQKIFAFRQTLLDPTKDPLPEAQALYRHLVTPIDEDLKQAKAQTLMISLDGTLRYIPLAALHDGEHYLIERYGLATFTPAAKLSLDWPPKPQWTAAGLGVSKASLGFKPLPAVQGELEGIIRRHGDDKDGVLPGVMHLDDEFTAERLAGALEEGYAVIHIASHFVFKPGTDLDSFLLLGKGARLSLAEIKEGDFSFHELDLLTLSACETAMGVEDANGREIESCGALAQNQGARGVLATLWAVADKSTGLFMQWFYRIREGEGATKAEALRQAQIVFIRGGSQTHYTHPYYWAPFILMGNWL